MRKRNSRVNRYFLFFLIIIFFIGNAIFFPKFSSASSSATMDKVADIVDGGEQDVYIVGTKAYIACGWGGLKVYNISNPNGRKNRIH